MVAPTQRDVWIWPRREAMDRAEAAERKKEFAAIRETHQLKVRKMEQKKQQDRDKAKGRWEHERAARAHVDTLERQRTQGARRRLFGKLEHSRQEDEARLKSDVRQSSDIEQRMSKVWGGGEEQQSQRARFQSIASSLGDHDRLRDERRALVARAAAEEGEERRQHRAVTAAQKAEIVANRHQTAAEARRAMKWQQANMAYATDEQALRQQARYKMRRARGEAMRDDNVAYLNTDTRVAKWEEICFHDPTDPNDWRWPFHLDWSWLTRGDHILQARNERFAGLTLPAGFVKPSDRIMSARAAERDNPTPSPYSRERSRMTQTV